MKTAGVNMKRLKAIAKRLKRADPGPWYLSHSPKSDGLAVVDDGLSDGMHSIRCEWPNARFIVNAPTDIAYLLRLACIGRRLAKAGLGAKAALEASSAAKRGRPQGRRSCRNLSRAISDWERAVKAGEEEEPQDKTTY